jgi:glyoxylase-like metal-dependent hydrolase (beta-lactamase superfamily II)
MDYIKVASQVPEYIMSIKRSFIIFFISICLYSFSGCGSKQITLKEIDLLKVDSLIKVQKINDRAIIVNFGYDAVTAIKTELGIVLIDAGISTILTSRYRKDIENEFRQDNYIYVINTHCHHDHIRGNSVFSQAKVIGHENCQEEVSEQWRNPEKLLTSFSKTAEDYDLMLMKSVPNTDEWNNFFTQKIRYMCAYCDLKNHISFKLPDITFADSMKLELGDITFEMIYSGEFHSNSDILIYVPEFQVIFTGDLFSKYGRPGISGSSIPDAEKLIRATRWIEKRMSNIEKVIEGHGQILSKDDLRQFTDNISNRYSGKQINKQGAGKY